MHEMIGRVCGFTVEQHPYKYRAKKGRMTLGGSKLESPPSVEPTMRAKMQDPEPKRTLLERRGTRNEVQRKGGTGEHGNTA